MSSMKERLRRLTGGSGSVKTGVDLETEESSTVPSKDNDGVNLHSAAAQDASGPSLTRSASGKDDSGNGYTVEQLEEAWRKQNAELIRSSSGSFIRRRILHQMDHVHGDCAIHELHSCSEELTAFHGGSTVRPSELLFFDTETTGLGLGAGNVPFMIGLGYWEEEGFAVEQLFIRNPAEELAMLAYLKPILERFPYIVSYNGKSFDWPLLLNRFVMNRMKDGITQPQHFDFLYPSRSLWRNTLPSCRLGKVEEAQLGFYRVDDVPGSMAPTLYFLYLAEKRPGDIGPVFIHNELDILSLAGLAVLFAKTLKGHFVLEQKSREEQFRLGLWLHKMGKEELSRDVLQVLYNRSTEGLPEEDGPWYIPLAAHFKQLGAWDEAVELWQRAIRTAKARGIDAEPPIEAYVELSMFYEHKQKDYAVALLYAEEVFSWQENRHVRLAAVSRRNSRLMERNRSRENRGGQSLLELAGTDQGYSLTNTAAELNKRISRLKRKLDRVAALQDNPVAELPYSEQTERNVRKKRKESSSASAVHETLTLF